jgi:hypothetical protein
MGAGHKRNVLNGASTPCALWQATMIDTLALALGHALLGVALLRLMLREDVDHDPRIDGLKQDIRNHRRTVGLAGHRTARRRAKADRAAADATAPADRQQGD